MDLWYYDRKNRRQGPFDITGITDLVNKGVIVPETIIESDKGRRVRASGIPNLRFPVPQVVREGQIPPPLPPRIEPEKQLPENSGTVFPGPYPGDVPANIPDQSQPSQGGQEPQGENPLSENPTPPTGSGAIKEESANRPTADTRPAKALPTKKKGGFGGWLMDFSFTRLGILYHYRSFAAIIYVLYVVVAFCLLFALACRVLININGSWQELGASLPFLGPFFALVCLLLLFLLLVIRCCLEFGILLVDFLVTATRAAQKYLEPHHQEQ